LKFVVEHSVSTHLTEALAILAKLDGDEVVHLRGHYEQETLDPVWLGLGEKEPDVIVISADTRISKSPAEQEAWLKSGLRIFFLRSFAGLPPWQQAAKLIKAWPDIVKAAARAPKGSGYLVTVHGKIEKLAKP
jgi:PIN domain-containing protein